MSVRRSMLNCCRGESSTLGDLEIFEQSLKFKNRIHILSAQDLEFDDLPPLCMTYVGYSYISLTFSPWKVMSISVPKYPGVLHVLSCTESPQLLRYFLWLYRLFHLMRLATSI